MRSKERLLKAIRHEETDRVPIDLGGWQSGITYETYDRVKKRLGVQTETIIEEKMQGLAWIDEEILRAFQVDTR